MENIFTFLKKIKKNNHKAWFDAHKQEYLNAKDEFTQMVVAIHKELSKKDKSLAVVDPAKSVFRIYRDVRFSKDKTPYKTHFGAILSAGGKSPSVSGYYIHAEPGDCFVVAGIYQPDGPALAKIRQEIDYHLKDFKKIFSGAGFKKHYTDLWEENKSTKPPRGYEKDNPAIEYLKHKSFIVVKNYDDKEVVKADYPKKAAEALKAAYPLIEFLNNAVS